MKLLPHELKSDLSSNASTSFKVIALGLDEGLLYISGKNCKLGSDKIYGVITSLSDSNFSINSTNLPSIYNHSFWTNRECRVYECVNSQGSVACGTLLNTKVVQEEPIRTGNIWSFSLSDKGEIVVFFPRFGKITNTEFPYAPSNSIGQLKPEIIGTVENCPLIPISSPYFSTLSVNLFAGDTSIKVQDASGFTQSGAIWVDGETIQYSSKIDTELFGVTVTVNHKQGTIVAQVGLWEYLAAGHGVSSITTVKADDSVISGWVPDLVNSKITFPTPPISKKLSEIFTKEVNFDKIDSSGQQLYKIKYNIANQNANGYIMLDNLDVAIIPPSNVTAGTYSFTISWNGQTDTSITNAPQAMVAYLNGSPINLTKTAGSTIVQISITNSSALHLTHFTNLGNTTNLPTLKDIQVVWSATSNTTPALNPLNAIKGATGAVNQTASSLPGATSAGTTVFAIFPRPNNDRIISGEYFVAFSINLAGFSGEARLSIANKLVYYASNGTVVYSISNFTFDNDTDNIPIQLSGGGTVTITTLQRTVVTGNLDNANYATLQWPSNTTFTALQTTDNPNLGDISKTNLVIEWFSTDSLAGTVSVSFGGKQLGVLTQQQEAGTTINKTVIVDTITQGSSSFNNSDIATSIGGGTSSLSNLTTTDQVAWPVSYAEVPSNVGLFVYRARQNIVAPSNLVAGTYSFSVSMHSYTTSNQAFANLGGVSKSLAASVTTFSVFVSANQILTFTHEIINGLYGSKDYQTEPKAHTIQVTWNVSPITINNTPAYGSTTVQNNYLPNTGINVSLLGGNINIRVPSSPRTTVNTFSLPWVNDWQDLTNQELRIQWANGSTAANIALVRAYIAVEFSKETRSTPTNMSATVQGSSGNLADVYDSLLTSLNEKIDITAKSTLKDWSTTNNFTVARRIADPIDGLTILTFLSEQAAILLARNNGKVYPIRWLDYSNDSVVIAEKDCLVQPTISYASNRETDITINYNKNYLTDSFNKIVNANKTNNLTCKKTENTLKLTNKATIDAEWLQTDTSANIALTARVALKTNLLREVTLRLPYSFSYLEVGDLVTLYDVLWRVISLSNSSSSVIVNLTELP